jgi:Spy/CpxP family protein refolding chaperone
MNDETKNESTTSDSQQASPAAAGPGPLCRNHRGRHRKLWHRALLVGGVALLIAAIAYVVTPAHAGPHGFFGGRDCHRAGAFGGPRDAGPPDAKAMRYRAMYMAERALDEIDATDDQRKAVLAIVARTADDLGALHDDRDELRGQFMEALRAPTVDRAALEQLRSRKLAMIESSSERLVQAIANIADVLSADQRQKLGGYIESRREARWQHS